MKVAELMMRKSLPQKEYFKAAEVSSILGVDIYQLRYWESEFPQIRANRAKNGARIYRRRDVVLLAAINHLLHRKKMTISSAQTVIAQSAEEFKKDSDPLETKIDCDEFDMAASHHPTYEAEPVDADANDILRDASSLCDLQQARDDEVDEVAHDRALKALAILTDSKACLTSLLLELDKYRVSAIWHAFNSAPIKNNGETAHGRSGGL